MRRWIAAVPLAVLLVACGATPDLPGEAFALGHTKVGADGGCSLGWWTGGELVEDPWGGTAIRVEEGDFGAPGDTLRVIWWPEFAGRRIGEAVSVFDPDGNVVATTGQKVRLLAAFPMLQDGAFAVCGNGNNGWFSPLPSAGA
jgi:hypothetical protein